MNQREKVAHILRARGAGGVHTFELRQAYIGNPSERIADLEREGWVISHAREKLNGTATGTRYVKVSEPDVERSPSTPTPPGGLPAAGVALSAEPQTSLFPVAAESGHWRGDAA